ncbi:hypothetical protein [Cohnella sp. GCM10027633]|uniref:hypothetical protein n=1 Tax=unclassified Cohnella TaxID=2636738 RepID=UPI0036356951
MSELLDGAPDIPVNGVDTASPEAAAKKRARKRKEPAEGQEEAASPAVKRTRKKKTVAVEADAEKAVVAEAILENGAEIEAVIEIAPLEETVAIEAVVEEAVEEEAVAVEAVVEEAVEEETVAIEAVEEEAVEEEAVAEEPLDFESAWENLIRNELRSRQIEPLPAPTEPEAELVVTTSLHDDSKPEPVAEEKLAHAPSAEPTAPPPLMPIKFRPAEPTNASVDPSKRRRIEETDRRQRRAEGGQDSARDQAPRTRRTDAEIDRSFRIEPLSTRASKDDRDVTKQERAKALRELVAPIVPPDVKVFVPPSVDPPALPPVVFTANDDPSASESKPLLATRLMKAQELFAAQQPDPSPTPAAIAYPRTNPAEAEAIATFPALEPSTPVPAPEVKASPAPSRIWHKGLAKRKPGTTSKARSASRRKPVTGAAKSTPKRSVVANRPTTRPKPLFKKSAGRIASGRRKASR